jgi:hypothetical protein
VKKSFGLIAALIAVLFAVLLLPGCPTEAEDTNKGGNNTGGNNTTKLRVQNESSVTLVDVKRGSKVVSSRLAPSESTTVDVTEGTGYLYLTKGSADGLTCRTQEVITVTKDETTSQVITNNTVVVSMNDTTNVEPLGTITPPVSTAVMTWTGDWTRVSDTIYRSNKITNSVGTIERLNITASGAGTVTIQITAADAPYGYGYASALDTGVSPSDCVMYETRTEMDTYTYTIPPGSHWIQFMYQSTSWNGWGVGGDSVTVEIVSTTFTTE